MIQYLTPGLHLQISLPQSNHLWQCATPCNTVTSWAAQPGLPRQPFAVMTRWGTRISRRHRSPRPAGRQRRRTSMARFTCWAALTLPAILQLPVCRFTQSLQIPGQLALRCRLDSPSRRWPRLLLAATIISMSLEVLHLPRPRMPLIATTLQLTPGPRLPVCLPPAGVGRPGL
jgi:hypothetical protein